MILVLLEKKIKAYINSIYCLIFCHYHSTIPWKRNSCNLLYAFCMQIDLLDILRKSKYWERSAGRDHVIPMHHPNAFRFLRDQVNASILVVADFGRYPRNLAFLGKDVVGPYVHVVDSHLEDDPPDPFESRPTLLFFRGRTVRKDVSLIILFRLHQFQCASTD